jgi:outer membrane protein assembly factor BamA
MAVLAVVLAAPALPASAQQGDDDHGWQVTPLPILGYDSDEGFVYGAAAQADHFGSDGEVRPYRISVRPALELSTEGRRNITLFLDAPHLLPGGWRLTVYGGLERHTATPYYGIGNATEYDEALESADGPNPYYYRYGRTRNELDFDLQAPLPDTPIRFLLGTGMAKVSIDPTPHNEGTTLLASEFENSPEGLPRGWTNFIRGGIIWDTRDREIGPTRGVWSEILVKRAAENLAGDYSFTRWTLTDRRYYSLTDGLVLANRVVLQGTDGDAPFYEIQWVESSFKGEEALGGAKSLRGVPKNRYTGKGLFLWNIELRFDTWDFPMLGRDARLVTGLFVDSGRVWAEAVHLPDVFSDWHNGFGGGLRLQVGESFVAGLDVAHSSESTAPIYTGLGYLF